MKNQSISSAAGMPELVPRLNVVQSGLILLEVLVLTLLIPVARAACLHLVPAGTLRATMLQMHTGLLAAVLAVCLLLVLRGKSLREYGITLVGWPDGVKIAVLVCFLWRLMGLLAFPILVWVGVPHYNGSQPMGNAVVTGIVSISLVLLFWILRFSKTFLPRVPTALACILLLGLSVGPLLLAQHFGLPWGSSLLVFFQSVILSGVGEELVFRGYVQPRLNEVWGRPYCLGGVRFGWGLVVAALLFGFVHIFNGIDISRGLTGLNWSWAMTAFVGGLLDGYLREKTGSILSSAIVHGNTDAWVLIVSRLK
jgi:membrane protease YdiL (CAAX protease family)